MATLDELERAAEAANSLPSGVLSSIRKQETGGSSKYIDDPSTYHYPLDSSGRRVAGHTGKVSTAFGPYGILESTGADPGYGTAPLKSKALEDQVNFAASYLANRSARAGSLEAGLAGYGEGGKYANQVLRRMNNMADLQTNPSPAGGSSPVDQLATGNMQRNDIAAQALERTYADIGTAYKGAQAAMSGYGADSSLVVKTKALAEAEAQQKSQVFAATIGADPTVATYAMNKLILESQQLYEQKQAAGRKLAAAANPEGKNVFEFIADRITLPNRVREFATLDALEKNATQRLADINTLTQSTARTNNAVAQSVTTESALAMSRMATSEAAQKMAGLEIDALKTNSTGIIQVTQLRNDNLSIALKQRDQQIQEVQVVTARQNAAIQTESLRLAMQDRTERMGDKEEARRGQENMLAAINTGRKLSNLPEIRSLVELQTMAKMNPEYERQFTQQYSQGLVAAQTGRATVAETPFDALRYVKGSGAKFDDGRARVVEFLDKTLGQVQNDPKIPAADKQKEKVISSAVNSLALNQAAAMQQDITSGGKDNIYQPPPTATFLKDPGFASTYLATQILTPMHKGGMEALPIREATSALMQDMIAGKISPQQVDSELGYLGTKIMGYNNELYRYKDTAGIPNMAAVGVRLDDASPSQSFVNRIAGPGTPGYSNPVLRAVYGAAGGSGERIVNLADPVSRSDYINRQQAAYIPPVLRQQAVVQQQSKTGASGSVSPYSGRTASGKIGQE